MIHVNLVERVGHPLAMLATMVGNQHGVSFSQEVGVARNGEEDADDEREGSETTIVLEGLQVRDQREPRCYSHCARNIISPPSTLENSLCLEIV